MPALWLLPVVFLIHDGEELLTMPGWIAAHRQQLDHLAQMNDIAAGIARSLSTTTQQVAFAIGFVLLLILAATAGASAANRRGLGLYAYSSLLGAMFLHVFTHVAQAIIFGGYAPGLFSAVLAVLPGTLFIYKRLFEAKLLTKKSAVVTALIGISLFLPGVVLAHQIGRLLGQQ